MITFIGDVHGWLDRLHNILQQEPDGPYVFMGDLVDRGPDSRQVVALVRQLESQGRARCIIGNHEYALVKGVGCPSRGIPACADMYEAWLSVYGARPTLLSYGITEDRPTAAIVRQALGDDLDWMAGLPWVIDDQVSVPNQSPQRYIVVHAGLSNAPLAEQLAACSQSEYWWQVGPVHPACLYDKQVIDVVPCDLPSDTVLVSGHTHISQVFQAPGRLCIDTSGGLPDQQLSAVRWPAGQVLTSS